MVVAHEDFEGANAMAEKSEKHTRKVCISD